MRKARPGWLEGAGEPRFNPAWMPEAMLKRFEPDEILFRQGDESDFAVLIISGQAEVLRAAGDDAIVLGTVAAGEFVGEMGVIDGRPRSATVRAASRISAELIEREAFLERVSADADLAYKLLLRMSSRLRDVEQMLTDLYTGRGALEAPVGGPDELAPARTPAVTLIPQIEGRGGDLQPVEIQRLPFTVGRRVDGPEAMGAIAPDLAVPDEPPYRLSRMHFGLVAQKGQVLVRDFDSRLGTVVNGRPLGRDFPAASAPLQGGENIVVAGGTHSRFTFLVRLA